MKNLYWLISCLFLLPFGGNAQMFDNTWFLGYNNDSLLNNYFGITVLTFPEGDLRIEQNTKLMRFDFSETNTSLSDSSGNVLSYTNGVHIGNAAWEIMENGDYLTDALEAVGAINSQWVLALPLPGNPRKQIYFYENEGYSSALSFHAKRLLHGMIDLSQNSGLGKVVSRDVLVIEDTLAVGKINAVKHANGRDWWVVVNEKNANRFYRFLVGPNGIQSLGGQEAGIPVIDGVGQSVFSPNGRHYAVYNTVSSTLGAYIDLYDFDRCTGLLSNHKQFHFETNGFGGVAISPNSKFLYVNKRTVAYQYDLEAPDIWASRKLIATYDGFLDPFSTTFYLMQLAPDGKIYACATGGVKSLHVIHSPDEPGAGCQYQQHGIALPTYNSFSIPTFPNYRLGPLDGSPCDTLGLDNLPVAWWRSERDTLEPLHLRFHDLSYYEPTSWQWDFGDPASGAANNSSERHPQHTFPGPGDYQVCLTVSNANASNTLCRTLHFTASGLENPDLTAHISVWPNPFSDRLAVGLSVALRSPELRLYDQMGRLTRAQGLSFGVTEIDARGLPEGMYFWELVSGGARVKSGKVIKASE